MKKGKEPDIKESLVIQGVAKLKKYGFVNVTKTNITTDEVYALYFSKMLYEMTGSRIEQDNVEKQLQESFDILTNRAK